MSDHDETGGNSGYSTPVPELDDHRNQATSVQRTEHPRRGTFDSLYGRQPPAHAHSAAGAAEEAVDDGDEPDHPPAAGRSRRPTTESIALRSVSPPNSVKAFAEARRREREHAFSPETARPDRRDDEHPDLHRTTSVTSRQSFRSRQLTARTADVESASLTTNKSAEEDVCFPLQQDNHKDKCLHIDFDYLETFMLSEREEREAAGRNSVHAFPDLRPSSPSGEDEFANKMVTADGDILFPPPCADAKPEKDKLDAPGAPGEGPQHSPGTHPSDPGRVSFFSSAWESTIHAADLEGLVLPGEDIRGLFTFPKEETADGVWWLNINKPGEDEVRAVCRAFGIHPLTIEDITTQEAREKIELFSSYYFACFRSFYVDKDEKTSKTGFVPFNIYVIVFREGTLSFSYANNMHSSNVRKRIAMLKDYVALSSDWICYALIDDIVDSFAPVISGVERGTDQIEDEVFVARPHDMAMFLRKIGSTRKNVNALMRLLGGKADVLRGFTKRCNENYMVTPRMDIGLYLGDIQDHVVTMMTNLGHFEKMLSRAHSNYLAQISIDGTIQGTQTNKVLSKITFFASIIVPLNLITGLFGMNVDVPWRDYQNLNAFFGILGFLTAFVVIILLVARRARWY